MDSFYLSQWLFIKGLAFTYLLAFWSLERQLMGLYGSNGLTPIAQSLDYLKSNRFSHNLFHFPSLFWFNASDSFIYICCWLGIIFSTLVILGGEPAPMLFITWVLYLSFVSTGSYFLAFQWDCLLLETGFLGIFFAIMTPPPFTLVLALWLLLFRLMFASGAVKILSRCPEWRARTAMKFHYETQPLPNSIAYYIHKCPLWFHSFSVYLVFFFELVVPFMYFGTAEIRLAAFILTVFFQFLIILTGNFAFFNVLAIVLCIPLLNDKTLSALFKPVAQTGAMSSPNLYMALSIVGAIFIFLGVLQLINRFVPTRFVSLLLRPFSYFYITNSYGLFARMTNYRDEIIIEGSMDGENWQEYEFYWKPDNLSKMPSQAAPYHPRLDWQMWFAALGHYRANPWFTALVTRLLEGSKEIRPFFKTNPFPDVPPKFVRALVYSYHFTTLKEKKKTGNWWKRTYKGIYIPQCSLKIKP